MRFTNVFAGVPVTDYDAAVAWYGRLFGREPDLIPNDVEAAWQVREGGWVYVDAATGSAGGSMVTLLVDDLDALVAELAGRGFEGIEIHDIPGVVRTVQLRDPDGNRIQLGQPAA